MFQVTTNSPMDERWLQRDDEIVAAAGRQSEFSGAGVGENADAGRDHGWYVETFDEAKAMKQRLDQVEGVSTTIREK